MKLKYQVIDNKFFSDSLRSLMGERLPVKTAYRVMKITKRIDEELEAARVLYKGIIDRVASKNEDGSIKMTKIGENMAPEILPEKAEEFQKEMQAFASIEFEIDQLPINMEELENVKMTAQELLALEPITTELKAV